MTPLQSFQQIVVKLEQKPFYFWPQVEQQQLIKNAKAAIAKLRRNLLAKKLTDTHAYKIIQALEKDVLETEISEVHFIQHLANLVEVYRLAPLDEELSEFVNELESNINKAKTKLLEYHLSIENLKKKAKKMSAEEKNKKDLETIQKVGIFYVLEYTLQVLWEFGQMSDAGKQTLLEKGLQTKAGSLPAYLPLEETFKKELCYRVFDGNLRNRLLRAFYNWEEVLYNKKDDFSALELALKEFNIELLQAFESKDYTTFKAAIYAPWGNNVLVGKLIDNIKGNR